MSELPVPPAGGDLSWLLGACRYWLTGAAADAPSADPDDWRTLASLGYFHDLDPLLHHLAAPERLDLEPRLPPRVGRQWEGAYYRNFVFNTELLDLLGRFLDGCERERLETRVFKGPVTASRGWLDPSLRVMADVDLLCREDDLPRLAELARELDFETGAQTATHHLALRHRTLPGSLELHFELYDVLTGREALLAEVWSEPAPVTADERSLPALDPELGALFDLAHLLQHDLQLNLRQLLDLSATLWRQRRSLDPRRLRHLLRQADLGTELDLLATVLARHLGLPVPDTWIPRPAPAAAATLAAAVIHRLETPDELDRVGALAGSHRRAGAVATAGYAFRRLLPPIAQMRAMSGAGSTAGALLGYPSHIAATLGRAWRRWRKGGSRPGSRERYSIKAELFHRRDS